MEEFGDVTVPQLLQQGTPMTKVSSKKHKRAVFRLDPDIGQIVWESKQHRIIPIENIKEIRSGSDTRYYREQFQLAPEYEDRWITIVYIMDGNYKTLHLIAATKEVFRMWDTTLRKLHAIRQELMSGLGNIEMRQTIWEKQYWKGKDEEQDQKLAFDDVEKLCKRLNINSSSGDLLRIFKQADTNQRNYLNFEDFRRFVKLLKGRPEIDTLYKKLRSRGGGVFDFPVFENFMKEIQKSSLTPDELQALFDRYSENGDNASTHIPETSSTSISSPRVLTVDGFTSFLLSSDNSAFADQHGKIWHDMTRPLPDYYISSSHNTYLVGHQLVGMSTIEGYIRALLHSCRSVELDIYDSDPISEPMIFHGKTFTSKVPLRDVCHVIAKYGFVASPYPIIISAEMHCSVPGQDSVVKIMKEVFGDSLVQAPLPREAGKIETLPSPEDLKGRILLKTKNLNLGRRDSMTGLDGYYSTTENSSTSDSDAVFEQSQGSWAKSVVKRRDSDAVKELKGEIMKAGSTVLKRVRSVGKSHPSSPNGRSQSYVPLAAVPIPAAITLSTSPTGVSAAQAFFRTQAAIVTSPTPTSSMSMLSQSPVPINSPQRRASETEHTGLASPTSAKLKPKMSQSLLDLLVYTVGVKCRGINKKEVYAPEHMFSLSETMANRMLKTPSSAPFPGGGTQSDGAAGGSGMQDLIKHCKTHMVRVYPKATRVNSTNFEPHRYWSAGVQLVAINWQTFDLGCMINHAMFQRNGRTGYVLKPPAIRSTPPLPINSASHTRDLLSRRTNHHLDVSIISAQQLPRPKDSSGREIIDKSLIDPFVEVSIHIPDWTSAAVHSSPDGSGGVTGHPLSEVPSTSAARTISYRTGVVKNNGFNPVWEEKLRIPFDCVGDMKDLIFVRFVVRQAAKEDVEPLAVYCISLGSLGYGYRHLPLHDMQLSQYLFSTLFVRIAITDS